MQFESATEYTQVFFSSEQKRTENVLKETPVRILSREYKIHENLAYADFTFNPLQSLLGITEVANTINTFRGLRCGIKIRFEQNTTPMHYGAMNISWLPQVTEAARYQVINADPTLMDITSRDLVELNIPFISTNEFWPINVEPFSIAYGPTIYMKLLGAFTTDSSVAAPTFSVYASMVNPEVFGANCQSGAPVLYKEALEIAPLAQTAVNLGLASLATNPTIKTAVTAAQVTNQIVKHMWANYSSSEASEKAAVPSNVRNEAFGDLAGGYYAPNMGMSLRAPNMVEPYHLGDEQLRHRWKHIAATPCISSWFTIGSNVPANTYYGPRIEPWTQDVFGGPPQTNTYMDELANVFRYWRGSVKMRIIFYTSPLISASFRIGLANILGSAAATNAVRLRRNAYSRLVQVRGTTVVDFMVPYVNYEQYTPLKLAAGSGALLLKDWFLYIVAEKAPTQVGDQEGKVLVVTCLGAGDDFQFKDMRSMMPEYQPASRFARPEAVMQMNLRRTWDVPFENITGGSNQSFLYSQLPEDDLTIEDMSMRYSSRTGDSPDIGLTLNRSTNALKNYDVFDWLQGMFRYVRGSYRLKIQVPDTGTEFSFAYMPPLISTTSNSLLGVNKAGNGYVSNSKAQNRVLDIEVPFMCPFTWAGTEVTDTPSEQGEVPNITFPGNVNVMYIAAGRDYQLAFLMPPRQSTEYPYRQNSF